MKTMDIIHRLALAADSTGNFVAHLAGTSFYSDPASIQRHRSYPGGLADHCLGLALHLYRLAGRAPASLSTVATIAIGHDLCKVGTYQRTAKSQKVKNPDGTFKIGYQGKPVWEDVIGYEYVAPSFPLGHGDSSVMRLMRAFPRLSDRADFEDIVLAIRWHMGAYQCSPGEEMNRMGDAMARTPLVIWTQTADLLDTYHGLETAQLVEAAAESIGGLL